MRSSVSWAKVGRELVPALARTGAHVSAVPLKGFLHDEAFALPAEVEVAARRPRREGWDLALDYPPNFRRLDGRHRAGIVIYEADRLPSHWVEPIREYLDAAIVPSTFSLEAAAASGVPARMLAVAPFGVNTAVYRQHGPKAALPTGAAFNFLAVAAPHVRKGLAELTAAFSQAFAPSDDVGLVIKCPPLTSLGGRPWEYASVAEFMPAERRDQITLVSASLTEQEMAALYRAADVYVQPSYGESFGLAPLEALACGKPVIATGWGGALSYLDESNAWLIDYDLVEASSFAYDWPAAASAEAQGSVHMARPRVEHLAELLRRAYEDIRERRAKAVAGPETAASFTWDRAATAVTSALDRD